MIYWKRFLVLGALTALAATLIPDHFGFLFENPFLYGVSVFWLAGSLYAFILAIQLAIASAEEDREVNDGYLSGTFWIGTSIGIIVGLIGGPIVIFVFRTDRADMEERRERMAKL